MKFRSKILELGTRFYKFINEEEYKIFSLVKINSDESAEFMDEETFEIQTIDKEDLEKNYTMLINNSLWILCKFRNEFYEDEEFWLQNEDILIFQTSNKFYKIQCKLRLHVYKFMKKSVFNKVINYIMTLNNPYQSLSDNDLNAIWDIYFRYMEKKTTIIKVDNKISMDDVVNNKAKIPDSVFLDAEELLNTYIISYDAYEFDDSVNINNVNMKYFMIYNNDKYYIILYVTDNNKVERDSLDNLSKHMDVVKFMLK